MDLQKILNDHKKWLNGEKGGKQADLQSADLRSANLQSANLQSADLRSADLRSANLQYANLQYANLQYANLRYANLQSANLRSADLRSADLRSANLQYANLQYANLQYANLRYANLQSANLQYAKNLNDAYIPPFSICPTGSFVGWKKLTNGVIAKLQIPASADRVTPLSDRKLRASKVKTLALWDREGNKITGQCNSGTHWRTSKYEIGKYTHADKFNDDIREVCTNGIHFFITREEAEAW